MCVPSPPRCGSKGTPQSEQIKCIINWNSAVSPLSLLDNERRQVRFSVQWDKGLECSLAIKRLLVRGRANLSPNPWQASMEVSLLEHNGFSLHRQALTHKPLCRRTWPHIGFKSAILMSLNRDGNLGSRFIVVMREALFLFLSPPPRLYSPFPVPSPPIRHKWGHLLSPKDLVMCMLSVSFFFLTLQ